MWGNYCNVLGGPVPVNIYYSTDGGETVKIAYSFGRNPNFQEKGRRAGVVPRRSEEPGHLPPYSRRDLQSGRAASMPARATSTADTATNATGCAASTTPSADRWDWKVLISVNANSRYKSGGINFVDGQLYWAADANGPEAARREIRSRHLPLRSGGPHRSGEAHAAFRCGIRNGEHDYSGRRDHGRALRPASTFKTGIAYLARHGQDMGRIRPRRIRPAIARPLPAEEQRRLVPRGPAERLDRAGRGVVHQAESIMTWPASRYSSTGGKGCELRGVSLVGSAQAELHFGRDADSIAAGLAGGAIVANVVAR